MLNFLDDSQLQPPDIYVEATWLYGTFITAILYGIVVVLYVMCAHSLWLRICSHDGARKRQWFLFIYVHFIFILNTFYVAADLYTIQLGFINNRNYPGGPSAYELDISSTPLNVSFTISNWSTDALMIWRCVVVYRSSKFYPVVACIGCLMLLASIVAGFIWVVVVSRPATGWMSFTFLFPYLVISLSINIFICILTILRLLYHRACISKIFGPKYGVLYTHFSAMIIESSAVYAICSLLYLVTFAMGSSLANACSQFLCESQTIASLLILYRVSEGNAWTRDMDRRIRDTGSYVIRRDLKAEAPPAASQPRIQLDVQVAFQSELDTECGGSTQTAVEEGKDLAG